ncbi:hypothetical protein A7K91_05470 [Paenibacillus oryzae]|uniref:DUF1836 domain-containing protein n=2 Tax=Paenibacillus oryzae TaxID=1844972 RepID=A0A1A5YHE9_9BACL|nr:hypothetical protein A7K91_05470 [Paenibacillus oryzae]
MEGFRMTRSELAEVLVSLKCGEKQKTADILRQAWKLSMTSAVERSGGGLPEPLPSIVEKLMRSGDRKGLSLHEIAELGQLAEYACPAATSLQNWVKRDFKDYFESPQAGKKYSLDQAALLLIIDDLKTNLDFESLRRLFSIVFMSDEGLEGCSVYGSRLSPLDIYAAYADIYEELKNDLASDRRTARRLENEIRRRAEAAVPALSQCNERVRQAIKNLLLLAVISVQSAFFQAMARRYCQETLYLGRK